MCAFIVHAFLLLLFIWFPDIPAFGSCFQITRRRHAQAKCYQKTPLPHFQFAIQRPSSPTAMERSGIPVRLHGIVSLQFNEFIIHVGHRTLQQDP